MSETYVCSKCGTTLSTLNSKCPKCGAKIDWSPAWFDMIWKALKFIFRNLPFLLIAGWGYSLADKIGLGSILCLIAAIGFGVGAFYGLMFLHGFAEGSKGSWMFFAARGVEMVIIIVPYAALGWEFGYESSDYNVFWGIIGLLVAGGLGWYSFNSRAQKALAEEPAPAAE